jgi:hypothetical protein
MQHGHPEAENDAFMLFARSMCWASRGLYQHLRDRPGFDVLTADADALRRELGIEEPQLEALQKALSLVRKLEAHHPGALASFEHDDGDRFGERKIDGAAITLEAFYPGRVQEILGRTKLRYFGAARLMIYGDCIASSEDFDVAADVWISLDEIARSALFMRVGEDQRGLRYAHVMFFRKLQSEGDPEAAIGESLGTICSLYLFEDGTASRTLSEDAPRRR